MYSFRFSVWMRSVTHWRIFHKQCLTRMYLAIIGPTLDATILTHGRAAHQGLRDFPAAITIFFDRISL